MIAPAVPIRPAGVDALKRLQAETAQELDALLPAILDRAFKGEFESVKGSEGGLINDNPLTPPPRRHGNHLFIAVRRDTEPLRRVRRESVREL
jgi:hypothetical protein